MNRMWDWIVLKNGTTETEWRKDGMEYSNTELGKMKICLNKRF